MKVCIEKSKLGDFDFAAPPSKSYTHRAYTIATLAEGSSVIRNPLRALDTESTLNACRAFGADIKTDKDSAAIKGTGGNLTTPGTEIDAGNSGTTIRFFTSIAGLDGKTILTGDESIQKRPMGPLLEALTQLGVEAVSLGGSGTPPVKVSGGGIKGGTARIRGDISSQFISSLLIAAPYAKKDVRIEITTLLKSRPYVDLTLDIMKDFGVKVVKQDYRVFSVPREKYRGRNYSVEGDYSQASYFLALAAMGGVKCEARNLNKDSAQGDRIVLDVLEKMGVGVVKGDGVVEIEGTRLVGVEVDLKDTPDLLPTVSALGCIASGKTVVKNIGHARYKETDRVSACATEFSKFGARIREGEDYLMIEGTENPVGGKVNSHGDHRMVMALAVLGAVSEGMTTITNAESVDISYPGFFKDLKAAGVKVKVI